MPHSLDEQEKKYSSGVGPSCRGGQVEGEFGVEEKGN